MKTKILAILVMALTLSSCGYVERLFAAVTGGGTTTCFGGVTYIQFTSGASVAYNPDGTIMVGDC